jgi:hypothetical protein
MDFWVTEWNSENSGNNYGIGWPEGFWDGATYRIISTPGGAESTGTVISHTHVNNRHQFQLSGSSNGYILFLTKKFPGTLPDWNKMTTSRVETVNPHGGEQCYKLVAPDYYRDLQDSYYRDSDQNAHKFLIPNGSWTWKVWARGTGTLNLKFRREGGSNWCNHTINLTSTWTQYTTTFTATDDITHPDGFWPLLVIEMIPSGTAYIDDVELYPTDNADPYFMDEIVEKLQELNPGVIRYWGEQLGASAETMLANQFERRMVGWKPQVRTSSNWNYSYPEFFHLCETVGAIPWIVLPPTLSEAEYVTLFQQMHPIVHPSIL